MKAIAVLLLAGLAGLTGCATVTRPPEAATVALQAESSSAVALYQPKLTTAQGQLVLDGWVYRQFGAETTARTHIDIAFLDGAGRELRRELTRFMPNDLRRGSHKMAHRGRYTLPITALPSGTTAIQIRAHDAPEHQP
jgi:hypothetical protein